MTKKYVPQPSGDDERFQELLVAGNLPPVEAPPEFVEQVRGKLHEHLSSASHVATPPANRFHKQVRMFLAGLAIVAAGIFVALSVRSDTAWAQVAEAVRNKPWIHMSSVDPAGKRRELWLSFSRDVGAINDSHFARYDNYRSGVRHEFDRASKSLIRVSVSDPESFASMSTFFRAIFRGDAQVGERFAEDSIVAQEKRQVVRDGKTWIEHELKIQRGDQTAVVIVQVDLTSKLPVLMRLTAGAEQMQYDFDYPDNGPADIFALDVPREAVVEDRVPPAELSKITQLLNANRNDLDNYVGIVLHTSSDPGSLPYCERIVWRKGDKWRVEIRSQVEWLAKPAEGDNMGTWVREHLKQWETQPLLVCDGRKVWRAKLNEKQSPRTWTVERTLNRGQGHAASKSFGDSSGAMIENAAFPEIMASTHSTLKFDATGKGGPPATVLVEVSFNTQSERAYRTARYWLDAEHMYCVVRSELADCAALENDPQVPLARKREVYRFGEFRQSPRGIWYPSMRVRENASWTSEPVGDNKEELATYHDEIKYYYLDFETDLPDELFTPTDRAK